VYVVAWLNFGFVFDCCIGFAGEADFSVWLTLGAGSAAFFGSFKAVLAGDYIPPADAIG
jgi:hypothetical protein